MIIKKKISILLIGALSICLFFVFGFQIGVDGIISKDGGTASVMLTEPLRIAADEADAALKAAEMALADAQAILDAAQLEADEANAVLLVIQGSGTPEEILAAQKIADDAQTALKTAELAVIDAQAILDAAQLAADEANTAYSGLKTRNDEELEAIQLAADKANALLEKALAEGAEEDVIAELQLAADEAKTALEEFEPGTNRIRYSHIITNSNNGGSFNSEGNHSGIDGDLLEFTFDSELGYNLVWLRIGNIKVEATDGINPYDYDFDKKNLTIHAHFKKDKDYSPEITTEETDPEEDMMLTEENDDEKDNGKGKDKDKSNNGKKDKKK